MTAAAMLLAFGGIMRADDLRPMLAADQSTATTAASQHADVLQDIIDAINGILGSGSGSGTGSGSGSGGQPKP